MREKILALPPVSYCETRLFNLVRTCLKRSPHETINAVCAEPMSQELTHSNIKLSKAAGTLRNMITRNRPRSLCNGCQ